MLCGVPPFFHDELEKIYKKILKKDLEFPKKPEISREAKDLLCKLLDRNVNTRLGAKMGFYEIKEHPFFSKLDFEKILAKEVI